MKRIVIGMLVCALCVGLAAVATVADFEKKESRIHQHLVASEKAPCSHKDNRLCTHLPLVEIETGGHEIPGAPVLDDKGFIVGYTVTEAGESRLKATVEITDNTETILFAMCLYGITNVAKTLAVNCLFNTFIQ